jgi:hypothetical protein
LLMEYSKRRMLVKGEEMVGGQILGSTLYKLLGSRISDFLGKVWVEENFIQTNRFEIYHRGPHRRIQMSAFTLAHSLRHMRGKN